MGTVIQLSDRRDQPTPILFDQDAIGHPGRVSRIRRILRAIAMYRPGKSW